MRTYNEIYLSARRKLRESGIEAATLEGRLIAMAAAGKTEAQFVRDMNYYASEEYEEKVEGFVKRRISGEPVAYITGEWEFMGIPLNVTKDVLIPRTDTEVLAETAIAYLRRLDGDTRCLDLCCGTGCIGIAIADRVPSTRVVLIDNSKNALSVARGNTLKTRVSRSTTCMEADALQSPPMLLGRFDLIVCNPPYIPAGDIKTLDKSVRDFEPLEALDGGKDGLRFYRIITEKWKCLVKSGGVLMYECGIGQADDVENILSENGFTDIKRYRDTLGIDRVVTGTMTGGK